MSAQSNMVHTVKTLAGTKVFLTTVKLNFILLTDSLNVSVINISKPSSILNHSWPSFILNLTQKFQLQHVLFLKVKNQNLWWFSVSCAVLMTNQRCPLKTHTQKKKQKCHLCHFADQWCSLSLGNHHNQTRQLSASGFFGICCNKNASKGNETLSYSHLCCLVTHFSCDRQHSHKVGQHFWMAQ